MKRFESDPRHRTGAFGERLAEWFLRRRGYRVLHRNHRACGVEVDLVVERDSVRVLVEVKTRRAGEYVDPARIVGARQRARIANASQAFAGRARKRRGQTRLDLVLIEEREDELRIRHYVDAFGAGGELR